MKLEKSKSVDFKLSTDCIHVTNESFSKSVSDNDIRPLKFKEFLMLKGVQKCSLFSSSKKLNEKLSQKMSFAMFKTQNIGNYVFHNIVLLDFRFLLYVGIIPLGSAIILSLISFAYLNYESLKSAEIDISLFWSLKPESLKCHEYAYPYYNSYLKRYQCVCLPIFAGNGRDKCDICGDIRKNNPFLRIVGGRKALANTWPMAVYLEQDYKHVYFINGSYLTVSKVSNFSNKKKINNNFQTIYRNGLVVACLSTIKQYSQQLIVYVIIHSLII